MSKALQGFDLDTREWFQKTFSNPTPVQEESWPLIASGKHVLLSAPTGTGKTLAAFLVFINHLKSLAKQEALAPSLHVIYVSPLKALGNDVRENLRRPLDGIAGPDQQDVYISSNHFGKYLLWAACSDCFKRRN